MSYVIKNFYKRYKTQLIMNGFSCLMMILSHLGLDWMFGVNFCKTSILITHLLMCILLITRDHHQHGLIDTTTTTHDTTSLADDRNLKIS